MKRMSPRDAVLSRLTQPKSGYGASTVRTEGRSQGKQCAFWSCRSLEKISLLSSVIAMWRRKSNNVPRRTFLIRQTNGTRFKSESVSTERSEERRMSSFHNSHPVMHRSPAPGGPSHLGATIRAFHKSPEGSRHLQ